MTRKAEVKGNHLLTRILKQLHRLIRDVREISSTGRFSEQIRKMTDSPG